MLKVVRRHEYVASRHVGERGSDVGTPIVIHQPRLQVVIHDDRPLTSDGLHGCGAVVVRVVPTVARKMILRELPVPRKRLPLLHPEEDVIAPQIVRGFRRRKRLHGHTAPLVHTVHVKVRDVKRMLQRLVGARRIRVWSRQAIFYGYGILLSSLQEKEWPHGVNTASLVVVEVQIHRNIRPE